jgi:cell division protein FtsW (lipid II flippase)
VTVTAVQDPQREILRRTFKARRRTELGLLIAASGIVVGAYTLMILGNTAKVPNDVVPLMVAMVVLGGVAHIANRIFVPSALPIILPIAFLLNGLGYVMIERIDLGTGTSYAPLQAAWTAGGIAAYVITLWVIRRSRDLDRYRYLLLTFGVIFLLLPLVPHIGHADKRRPVVGARRIVHVPAGRAGPARPVHLLRLLLRREARAAHHPTARFGNRLVVDPRPLVPIVLAWAFAIGVMSLEHDIGFSALLFTLFIGMLWVTTGRTGYLLLGVALFAVGAYVTGRYLGQTHVRVEDWLDPWKYFNGSGRQLVEAWFSLGSGGIGGIGPRPGSAPTTSPTPTPTSSSPSSVRRWGCSGRPWCWWRSCCWWEPASESPRWHVRSSPSSPRSA